MTETNYPRPSTRSKESIYLVKSSLETMSGLKHACRHHIMEIIIGAAIGACFGPTSGPTVPIFKRFQDTWKQIIPVDYDNYTTDQSMTKAVGCYADSIEEFAKKKTSKNPSHVMITKSSLSLLWCSWVVPQQKKYLSKSLDQFTMPELSDGWQRLSTPWRFGCWRDQRWKATKDLWNSQFSTISRLGSWLLTLSRLLSMTFSGLKTSSRTRRWTLKSHPLLLPRWKSISGISHQSLLGCHCLMMMSMSTLRDL